MENFIEIAKQLRKQAPEEFRDWSDEALAVWLKTKCRCAYCDRALLDDRGLAYYFSTIDHILPISKYGWLAEKIWNKVLSCRSCNLIKRDFNPVVDSYNFESSPEPSVEKVNEWIRVSRKHCESIRTSKETSFKKVRDLLVQLSH